MKILVTGSTGNVGRHLIRFLSEMGHEVLAFTRNKELPPELRAWAQPITGDLQNPETLRKALVGVDAVHLITIESSNHHPLSKAEEIIELILKSGVQRVSITSDGSHGPAERAIENHDLEWTILKPIAYMSNTLHWVESIRKENLVRDTYGLSARNMIDEADVALTAAHILSRGGHSKKTYSLTGPEVLTTRQRLEILGQALGKKIELIQTTEDYDRKQMQSFGMTEETIQFVLDWNRNPPPAAFQVLPHVQEITGHQPGSYREWVRRHIASFK